LLATLLLLRPVLVRLLLRLLLVQSLLLKLLLGPRQLLLLLVVRRRLLLLVSLLLLKLRALLLLVPRQPQGHRARTLLLLLHPCLHAPPSCWHPPCPCRCCCFTLCCLGPCHGSNVNLWVIKFLNRCHSEVDGWAARGTVALRVRVQELYHIIRLALARCCCS
jgi:hypothetical protein